MINLIFAIFCSALIGLILKYSESKAKNRLVVTTANYFVAFTVSFALIFKEENAYNINILEMTKAFLNEFSKVFANLSSFSSEASFIWAVCIGVFGGFLYFSGFILIQKSINKNGIGITGAFSKASILIPIILSILLWKEVLSYIQYIGIILIFIAIFLMSKINFKASKEKFNFVLLNMFIFVGLAEFSNKLFQTYALKSFNPLFLFFVFFTAFIISLIYTLNNNNQTKLPDVFIGFLVGIPNMLTSYFLIKAFETVKASIVFPVYSSMAIVLMAIGGKFLFSEKLSKRELTAIGIIVIAIVVLNQN